MSTPLACNWRPGHGAAVLVVQSATVDRVVDGIYRQLKQSAKSQFSGSLPAVLYVQLRDVMGPQLRRLGAEPVNGLGAIATRLFLGESRDHLAGICFVAPAGPFTRTHSLEGHIMKTNHQDVGLAYVFLNPKHPSANEIDV